MLDLAAAAALLFLARDKPFEGVPFLEKLMVLELAALTVLAELVAMPLMGDVEAATSAETEGRECLTSFAT